jgi:hypothetical protein
VQTAKQGNLVEGEGGIVYQPNGGGFRHKRCGHVSLQTVSKQYETMRAVYDASAMRQRKHQFQGI